MEAVILCGVQAGGKTSLFGDRFLETHVRISRDLLRTQHRERRLLELCLETRQPFVVDKTHATPAHRRPYVEAARAAGFRVVAYVVDVPTQVALDRNARRPPRRRVPEAGLLGTRRDWVEPDPSEGVMERWWASADGSGGWRLERAWSQTERPGVAAAAAADAGEPA